MAFEIIAIIVENDPTLSLRHFLALCSQFGECEVLLGGLG